LFARQHGFIFLSHLGPEGESPLPRGRNLLGNAEPTDLRNPRLELLNQAVVSPLIAAFWTFLQDAVHAGWTSNVRPRCHQHSLAVRQVKSRQRGSRSDPHFVSF